MPIFKEKLYIFVKISLIYINLSVFFKSCVMKGHTFKSIEQAYQWEKATRANDVRVAKKLLYTTNPRVAKSPGRSIKV